MRYQWVNAPAWQCTFATLLDLTMYEWVADCKDWFDNVVRVRIQHCILLHLKFQGSVLHATLCKALVGSPYAKMFWCVPKQSRHATKYFAGLKVATVRVLLWQKKPLNPGYQQFLLWTIIDCPFEILSIFPCWMCERLASNVSPRKRKEYSVSAWNTSI